MSKYTYTLRTSAALGESKTVIAASLEEANKLIELHIIEVYPGRYCRAYLTDVKTIRKE